MIPEVYIIAIENNQISQYYLNRTRPSWVNAGFVVNEHSACTPETLGKDYCGLKLTFDVRRGVTNRLGENLTDTEKAVWYSHLSLWNLCRESNTPIIVVEHDVLLTYPMELSYFETCKPIVAFATSGFPPAAKYCKCTDCLRIKIHNRPITAGGAYYLTPRIARNLINSAMASPIHHNSDGLIHQEMNTNGQLRGDHYRSYQLISSKHGATIDHGDDFLGAIKKEYIIERVIKNANI